MDFDQFKVTGAKVDLNKFKTDYDAGLSGGDLRDLRNQTWKELAELQQQLYAESKQSLLIVLQAMDAAGKDSSIAKLTTPLNAHGCQVNSFKKPSKLEMKHDFLWRIHKAAPAAGGITIFNRSHYEDVLVVKVHGWASPEKIDARYAHINNMESLLADRGTKVIKFMLNVSPEYQLVRLKQRLDNPGKNWKFNPDDLDERQLWADYMAAFEVAMSRCASEAAPWYVVPAENRRFRDVMLAGVVRDTIKAMRPEYPAPDYDAQVYTSDSIS